MKAGQVVNLAARLLVTDEQHASLATLKAVLFRDFLHLLRLPLCLLLLLGSAGLRLGAHAHHTAAVGSSTKTLL